MGYMKYMIYKIGGGEYIRKYKYVIQVGGGEAEENDQLGGQGGTGAHTGELIQGKRLLHNLESFPKHHPIRPC